MEGWPRDIISALCQRWSSSGAMAGTVLGLARGCCSSPPCHSPTTPCPAHGAPLGATGLLLGSVLGIRKEQQPPQGSSARCLWVLDVLSLQQQVPIIPRITGCSELAGPHRDVESHSEGQGPHSLGLRSTLLSQLWEALGAAAAPKPQGRGTGTGGRELQRDSWKNSRLSTQPAGAPQGPFLLRVPALAPQCSVPSSWSV